VHALIDHVSGALADAGDLDTVRELTDTLLRRGTGAARQRAVYARTGDLRSVVRDGAP